VIGMNVMGSTRKKKKETDSRKGLMGREREKIRITDIERKDKGGGTHRSRKESECKRSVYVAHQQNQFTSQANRPLTLYENSSHGKRARGVC